MKKSELWNPIKPINDIALLTLDDSLPFGKSPAELASRDVDLFGEHLILAGYGKTAKGGMIEKPQLRKVKVPYRESLKNGADYFAGPGDIEKPGEISNPVGGCFGDSGGPAYISKGGSLKLGGVIVRGPDNDKGGCKAGLTIMTNTGFYQDFIMNYIEDSASL